MARLDGAPGVARPSDPDLDVRGAALTIVRYLKSKLCVTSGVAFIRV
jgi:hypothetical protein